MITCSVCSCRFRLDILGRRIARDGASSTSTSRRWRRLGAFRARFLNAVVEASMDVERVRALRRRLDVHRIQKAASCILDMLFYNHEQKRSIISVPTRTWAGVIVIKLKSNYQQRNLGSINRSEISCSYVSEMNTHNY